MQERETTAIIFREEKAHPKKQNEAIKTQRPNPNSITPATNSRNKVAS
jgi:hypothetical protein